MRDHTPDFKMHELSGANKALVHQTVEQLLEKLALDGMLVEDSLLEFWVDIPGLKHARGTFRGGYLMPDSFVYITDYFESGNSSLQPLPAYAANSSKVWDDFLDELFYQIEIFTSSVAEPKGVTLELWAGNRQRPEGEWVYAVDRKIELV